MYLYQYIVMSATCCLFLMPATRLAFAVFAVSWVLYIFMVTELPGYYYFAMVATLDLYIGWSLNIKYRIPAYLSYSLIPITFFGLYMWWNDYSKFYYDLFYAIIETLRILSLIARGLLDGVRNSERGVGLSGIKYFLVRFVDFDSRQACGKMLKNTSTQKAQK